MMRMTAKKKSKVTFIHSYYSRKKTVYYMTYFNRHKSEHFEEVIELTDSSLLLNK